MLTFEEIKEIVKSANDTSAMHVYYAKSIEVANEIKDTFSDEYPKFMDVIRPKEPKKDKEYRKAIYRNPVKGHRSRILNKLVKIEQSEDFLVNYPLNESGQNELMDYCENNFNGYNSLINWIFSIGLNTYCDDPNAVLVILDKTPPERQSEGYKPYPYLFKSDDVLKFERNKYCLLREKDSININENIYYVIDDTNYWIFKEKNVSYNINLEFIGPIKHYCAEMPAKKIGQHIIEENSKGEQLLKSILSDTIADFRKAIARSSDMDIELNHHIHSLEWRMAPKKCEKCKGKGHFATKDDAKQTCDICDGKGTLTWGALDILEVDMFEDKFLQGAKSFPFNSPGGYVQRNIEALREIKLSYQEHIDNGYESIDFGILRKKETATAESGLSKQYNRIEFSQRIYSEGRHIIENLLVFIYKSIDSQLFGINQTKIKRIPDVTIPISFDVMSPEMVLDEIGKAKDAGLSQEIIGALELKYAKLVFGELSEETKILEDDIWLNPGFGKTADELVTLYGGGTGSITNAMKEVYFIIAANFKGFINRAMMEDSKWNEKDRNYKYSVLESYANEIINNRPKMPELPKLQVA